MTAIENCGRNRMKRNYNSTQAYLMMFIIHTYATSIAASAGVTAARMTSKYIPIIISSAMSQNDSNAMTSTPKHIAPNFYSSTMSNITPSKSNAQQKSNNTSTALPSNLSSSSIHDYIKNNVKTESSRKNLIPVTTTPATPDYVKNAIRVVPDQQKFVLPSNDEFHINTEFLTDQDIQSFKNKFNNETDAFTAKLSNYWTLIKDSYDEITNNKKTTETKNNSAAIIAKPNIMDRETVITSIKNITEKVFDPNDQQPLSAYITNMKKLAESLDPQADKEIIDAIDFLQKTKSNLIKYQNVEKNFNCYCSSNCSRHCNIFHFHFSYVEKFHEN